MKFLICIGGDEPSEHTIRFGGRITKAFEASVSVLYVGPPVPHSFRNEMWMSREKLNEWAIELPGVRFLLHARDMLKEMSLVKVLPTGEIVQRHSLKPGIMGAYELHLYGVHGEDIRLRLREGEIVEEIKKETEEGHYDLLIMGASQRRALLDKIVQFIDTSQLIVKNPRDISYKFLVCTDSSPAARRAELFGAKAAKFFHAPVTVLSVAKSRIMEAHAMEWVERASRFFTRGGVPHERRLRVGPVVESIVEEAGDDHVIVMGRSYTSEIKKFLFGTKAMKVIKQCRCPVMMVK